MSSHHHVGFWIRRYLPNEIAGTLVSLVSAWVAFRLTQSFVAAAIAGTVGENVGFYGVAAARNIRAQWITAVARLSHRRRASFERALWFTVVEFGPAEVLDTFAVRPLLLYLAPVALGMPVVGWIIGKILADAVFYTVAGLSYLVARRADAAHSTTSKDADVLFDAHTRADRVAELAGSAQVAMVEVLAATYGTPLLLIDPARVRAQYERLQRALPFVHFHYAVKAQPHPAIIDTLRAMGSGLDVASDSEVDLLVRRGVSPRSIIHTQPVKSRAEIDHAYAAGIRMFVIDSPGELAKFRDRPSDMRLLIRLAFRNPRAKSDLSSKFGIAPAEARALVEAAIAQGTRIAGFSFHVGSQLDEVEPFRSATAATLTLMSRLERSLGYEFDVLDIGGGFPVSHRRNTVSIEQIASAIRPLLEPHARRISIIAEPGRIMVADAATLVTRVIGTRERDGEHWAFIDDGLYGSYSNVFAEHVHPVILAHRELNGRVSEPRPTVIAGPTCDSIDIIARDYPLPTVVEGDLLVSPSMGAYTTVTATGFNGRKRARVLVLRDAESRRFALEREVLSAVGS